MPTGSSPVMWAADYASSSDEEYEGFFSKEHLLLSNLDKKTSDSDVVDHFFKGFKCTVFSKGKESKNKMIFDVKFASAELAKKAFKKMKDLPLKGHNVSFTRAMDTKYKSFLVSGLRNGSNEKEAINDVKNRFSRFGKVMCFFFPSKDDLSYGYLYMELNHGCFADQVETVRGLRIRECHMKGKVSRKYLKKRCG